jgi:hypothetical protein
MHVMEYYSVLKENEIMSCTTAWIDLEGIVLSKLFTEGTILHNPSYLRHVK